MSSDAPVLSIRSDEDVQITVYDAADVKQLTGVKEVAGPRPPGLYRVHLDRCGFVEEHMIRHEGPTDRSFAGPLLESPAPIVIARESQDHARLAQERSGKDHESHPPVGEGVHDARLLVFVRRVDRTVRSTGASGGPISIYDVTGRRLAVLVPERIDRSSGTAPDHVAVSCRIRAGTYRLRVGDLSRDPAVIPRDLAIPIPPGRAAHVFLADHGVISLRTARVYLPRVEDAFDPASDIARAMESVLWTLRQPRGGVPPIAQKYLQLVDRDLSFGVACAHLARRQADRATLDRIMGSLSEHAAALPDVAILECARSGVTPDASAFATPPLFRASALLVHEARIPVADPSALVDAAEAGHDDSVWCTWSPRWWDKRWIEPTVQRLRDLAEDASATVEQVAQAVRLPFESIERAFKRLDTTLPRVDGAPITLEPKLIPGYTLIAKPRADVDDDAAALALGAARPKPPPIDILGRGGRSTVFRARRAKDGREVAIKVIPTSGRDASDRIVRQIWRVRRLKHRHLARLDGCDVLRGGAGVWLATELCRGSLFDRLDVLGRPMGVDEGCDLVLEALDALAYLHAEGVVHGHIDPGSLLLREDGAVALGIPALPGPEDTDGLTGQVELDGDEARFAAPEVVLDHRAASAAADVWSMAATLYFLLTLELPRERYTDQRESDAVHDNGIAGLRERLAGIPDLIADCIVRALSPQVEERFRDGNELRDALVGAIRASRTAGRAAELYRDLVRGDPAYAITIRNVFLRMSALIGDALVRQWLACDDLQYEDAAENHRVDEVLRRFANAGLITVRAEQVIAGAPRRFAEPVHDELLQGWQPVRAWHDELGAVPGTAEVLPALGGAVRSWQLGERASSLLWNDRRAKLASEIKRDRFMYTAIEKDFVRRSRRWRLVLRGLLLFTISMLIVVGGFAVWAQWKREVALRVASVARRLAQALQESGRQYLLEGRSFKAMPYLVAASETGETSPQLRMMFHAATRNMTSASPLDHKDSVKQAAFSPDGARIVTASADGTARLWDGATGHLLAVLPHKGAVTAAAFSPDGKRVVTVSQDLSAALWVAQIWNVADVSKVSPDRRFEHHDVVSTAMFSPDGTHLVTACSDHAARILDTASGKLIRTLSHQDAVWSAVFSADGARVVTASRDRTARIWDAVTGEPRGPALPHRGAVLDAAFSGDGTRVVTASQDGTAQIWNAATGKRIGPPLQHREGVTSASFDARGTHIVTASYDGTARIWDARTGDLVTPPLAHRGSVTSAGFSPEGSRVVTASLDGTARVWDVRTGEVLAPFMEHTDGVASAVFSADGARIVTAGIDRTARVWNAAMDRSEVALSFDGAVRDAAFSPDGTRLATLSDDRIARIWDTSTGKLQVSLEHPAPVLTVAFSADGQRVVTASGDAVVRLWDVVHLWDVTVARALTASSPQPGRVTSARFLSDGRRVVITGADDRTESLGTLRVWDTTTGAQAPLPTSRSIALVQAWPSRDGTRLATLTSSKIANIWSSEGGPISSLHAQGSVTSVGFSPDGRRVVTSSEDSKARLWDATTGMLIAPPLEHQARVLSASFSPDGARVVTTSADGRARVWDAITGTPLTPPLPHGAAIVAAAFTADGARVVTVGHQVVRTWDVALATGSSEDWSKIAAGTPYVLRDGVLLLRSVASSIGSLDGPRTSQGTL